MGRCICASSARRTRGRRSRWAISMPWSRATPGLAAILTHRDVPGENSFGVFAHTRDQPVLAEGQVRFRGEAVLALVGTREAVEALSDADLPIAWTVETPVIGVEAARAAGAPAMHGGKPDNVLAAGMSAVRRRRSGAGDGRGGCGGPVRDRLRRARLYRAGGRLRRARRRQDRGDLLHPGALHGPRGDRARARRCARQGAHPADRLRRRLRRQARCVGAAAAGGGGAGDGQAGPDRLYAHRVHGLDHQAPSRQAVGARLGRPRGAPRLLRAGGRLQHRRLCLLGADRGGPRAGARHRALQGAERPQPRPRHLYQRDARPAPSAASASRRRPSRTRRCSTISPSSWASTAGTSAASTPSATAIRRRAASGSTTRPGCLNASMR